jgi:hypothetical protein
VKYLGTPLGIRKLVKLKFNNGVISKVEEILNKIATSGLKISQTIHAIKNYLLSKLDYVISNSMMSQASGTVRLLWLLSCALALVSL